MKRIVFLIVFFMGILFLSFTKELNADIEYVNLIDPSAINYNSQTGKYYSNQDILLEAGTRYTFVASERFFGNVLVRDEEIGHSCFDDNSANVSIDMTLSETSTGMLYTSFCPSVRCYLNISDFLISGVNYEDLYLNEVMIYQGTVGNFKGFISPKCTDGYIKVTEPIDLYTNFDNPITYNSIIGSFYVYDANDGELLQSDIEYVSGDYQTNKSVGVHPLRLCIYDANENVATVTVNIHVVDIAEPRIGGDDVIEWPMDAECPTIEDLREHLTITDNADTDITTSAIYIEGSQFNTFEPGVLKDYEVYLAAKDSSNNVGRKTITVSIYDTEAPVLVVRDIDVNLSELGDFLFDGDLIEQLIVSASDNSGHYTISYLVTQDVTGSGGWAGQIEIRITLRDSAGNQTQKFAHINVIDDIPPEIYILGTMLETTKANPYTATALYADIENSLISRGLLYDNIYIIESEIDLDNQEVGVYNIKYAYTYGETINYEIATITILEELAPVKPDVVDNVDNVVVSNEPKYLYLLTLVPLALGGMVLLFSKKKKKLIK